MAGYKDGITDGASARNLIDGGQAFLGIELGSTRIKASLIGPDHAPLASGAFEWENQLVDSVWTYDLDDVWSGLRSCYADLLSDVEQRYGTRPTSFAGIGVSAMMHGYLAFDAAGQLLVPFRTWRNTTTERAASELTGLFDYNIPQRWSVAHFYQAILDDEPHVPRVAHLTTLAGYVHWRLTGRKVLGVGDASGMFPIDPLTHGYDAAKLERFDRLVSTRRPGTRLESLLPQPLRAGAEAGTLTESGAGLLDPTGALTAGVPLCPPEGDAGTGMAATNSVAPRTGNISVGTSIFAMVVLERPLTEVHPELDPVTTPAGDPVAMVHCNNGASEIGEWARVFEQFAAALGAPTDRADVFAILFRQALEGEADGGGLLAYNFLSGEPIVGLAEGRPLLVRSPDSRLTLANLMRTQIYSAFATLSLGLQVLAGEGVEVDTFYAHGGLFKTEDVAQRLLAAAVRTPVSVGETAGEGGAWGIALLAAYQHAVRAGSSLSLADYLRGHVFAGSSARVVSPDPEDVTGFATFLDRYRAGLAIERAATVAV